MYYRIRPDVSEAMKDGLSFNSRKNKNFPCRSTEASVYFVTRAILYTYSLFSFCYSLSRLSSLLFSLQCSLFTLPCSLFSLPCSLFSLPCSLFSLQFRCSAYLVTSCINTVGRLRQYKHFHRNTVLAWLSKYI